MENRIEQNYSAMGIAKYAVSRRYKSGRPISNLQLQKILYFLQIIFASKTGRLLFADQFEAWPYGPVIREVYAEFADCGGFPIRRGFDIDVDVNTKPFLDAGIDTLAEKSPWASLGSPMPRGRLGMSYTTARASTRGLSPTG